MISVYFVKGRDDVTSKRGALPVTPGALVTPAILGNLSHPNGITPSHPNTAHNRSNDRK